MNLPQPGAFSLWASLAVSMPAGESPLGDRLTVRTTAIAGKKLNNFEMMENLQLAINSAKSIGLSVVNVHVSDLARAADDHKEHLVCGMMWQLVRAQLLSKITLKEHPQIVRRGATVRSRVACAARPATRLSGRFPASHTRARATDASSSLVEPPSTQYRLLEDGEDMSMLLKLPPDEILIRWLNHHLAKVRLLHAVSSEHPRGPMRAQPALCAHG